MTSPCDLVREQLDALLDGELEPALRDHVADCDACRDLRHEARRAADAVRASGGDYVHPSDFEARLMAALDARPEAAAPSDGGRITLPDGSPKLAGAAAAATAAASTTNAPAPRTEMMPAALTPRPQQAQPTPPPTAHGAPTRARMTLPRSRSFWIAGTVLTAMAAASPFIFHGATPNTHANTTTTAPNPLTAAREAWSGRLDAVARAAADHNGGVEIKRPGDTAFSNIVAAAEIPAGSEIRTDPRTRVRIELADGTHLILDRASTVRFDPAVPRSAALVTGALVADVSHVDGAPMARIALPTGGVTVLGTKFALTASDDRSTVRVTRGVVRMNNPAGNEVEVKTGEEGVLAVGAQPEVSPAVNLAESVAWSEFGEAHPAEPDAPIVGLGELRARRPGHSEENDHQVGLAAHSVRVRIVGNVARTEIDETFRNDTANELEGIYRFPLPPEAQIEKLSLDVRGRMEDGAFVDRQRAAAIWRGVIQNAVHPIQHEQQTDELVWVPGPWRDPALLEWQRGGRFELRIFPIPAHGTRRVTIAYTQTIAPSGGLRRYVYPLAHDANGSTRVEQFDVDVQVLGNDPALGVRPRGYALTNDSAATTPGATHMSFSQSSFVPAGDLVLEYALPQRHASVTTWAFQPQAIDPNGVGATTATPPADMANARRAAPVVAPTPAPITPEPAYVAIALRPDLPHWTESRPRDYALVLDTSRSMVGERLTRAVRLARTMVAEMDPRDRVAILACDTTCRQMPGGLQYAGAATVHAVEQFLSTEDAAGGSDLIAQVRAASALVGHRADRDGRIVYLGDGIATVGYRRTDLVAAEVAEAMPAGRVTLTTVALGHEADTTTLTAMARSGGGVAVPYTPGESVQTAALSVLESTFGVALRDPVLTLPSSLTEITPSRLPTLRAGSELLVAARMTGADLTGEAVLRGTVAGEPYEQRFPIQVHATTDSGNSFVPRLFAAQRIADLEAGDSMGAHDEIVQLSQRFHVPSRFTSLLVLESDAMYRAFGVRREAQNEVGWTGEQTAVATVAAEPAERARDNNGGPTVPLPAPDLAHAQFAQLETGTDRATAADSLAAGNVGLGGLGSVGVGRGGGGTGEGAGMHASGGAGGEDEENSANGDMAAPMTATATPPPAPHGETRASGGGAPAMAASESAPMATASAQMVAVPAGSAPMAPRPAAAAPVAGGMMAPPQGHASRSTTAAVGFRGRMSGNSTMDMSAQQPPMNRGQWMRRVWVRHAAVSFDRNARASDLSRVETARAALEALPDSKTRHQELYRWLSVSGSFDEAADIANRWATRDALDPDALTRLADVAARHGDRARAIRILGGTVDVRPDDVNALKRMITLHDRAGETDEACAYRISLAQVQTNDAAVLGDAVRCERTLGHASSAARVLGGITDTALRTRVDSSAPVASANTSSARGEIVLDANWDVPSDLDVALIDAQGRRISWLGGRNTGISVRGPRDSRSEALGLARASVGDYIVEISRAEADARAVSGRIEVTVLNEHRTLTFTFGPGEKTVRAGRISVTREEQLVPVQQF